MALEDTTLGRILTRNCATAHSPSEEWLRLEKTIMDMINDDENILIEITEKPTKKDGTLRDSVEFLVEIADVVGL